MTNDRQPLSARRFWQDSRGTTAVEYAIIASGIAGVLIAVIISTGDSLQNVWTSVKNAFG